jgi:biotin carboxyl carrier protein
MDENFSNVVRVQNIVSGISNGVHLIGECVAISGLVSVKFAGHHYVFEVPDRLVPASATLMNQDEVVSPMTGTIIQTCVAAGDVVTEGQEIVVVEAMKMEHRLLAPRDGVIASLDCAKGSAVDEGQILVSLATDDADG